MSEGIEEILEMWRQEIANYKKLIDEERYDEADSEFIDAEIRFALNFDEYHITSEYKAWPDGHGGEVPVIYFKYWDKYYRLYIADAYDDVIRLEEIDEKIYKEALRR